jgi:hypothetical protein
MKGMKTSAITIDWRLVCTVMKVNCGTIDLWNQNYFRKLTKSLTQWIAFLEENKWNCWFQQDAANAHSVKIPTGFVQYFFSDHIIRHDLGHHDPQTLCYPTSFCRGFLNKEAA